MTRDEALSVSDELLKLVASGPAAKEPLLDRALELVGSLELILGLGHLARQLLVNIKNKFRVHFGSSDGFEGVPAQMQRSDLKADIESLRDRLEEELNEEADYGPSRP
jgi:hypothetical protein